MMKSFIRVTDNLADLALDISNTKEKFASYVQQATSFYFKCNAGKTSNPIYGRLKNRF